MGGVGWYRRRRVLRSLRDSIRTSMFLPFALPPPEPPARDLLSAFAVVARRQFAFFNTMLLAEVRAHGRARCRSAVVVYLRLRRVDTGAAVLLTSFPQEFTLPRGPKRIRLETPLTDEDLLALAGAKRPVDEIKFEEYFGVTRWTAEALTEAFKDCGLPLQNGLVMARTRHVRTPLQATLILLARLHLPGDWSTIEDVFRDHRTG